MSGYTKLFNSILASTIWNEPNETRIVWITLLAMADKDGVAEGSVPGIAVFARLPLESTQKALEHLSAPDEYSRSQEHDGRRIEAIEGGWRLLNHAKYRAKMGADERREYKKLKARQYRQTSVDTAGTAKSKRGQSRHNTEAEAEADTEAGKNKRSSAIASYSDAFTAFWDAYPRKIGKTAAWIAWQKIDPSPALGEQILESIEPHTKCKQWRDGFVPHPRTYLAQGRYLDELGHADFYQARL